MVKEVNLYYEKVALYEIDTRIRKACLRVAGKVADEIIGQY